jgi:hypothetical protein
VIGRLGSCVGGRNVAGMGDDELPMKESYGAEWSRGVGRWRPVADSGSGGGHAFRVGTSGEPRMYFRYRITVAP